MKQICIGFFSFFLLITSSALADGHKHSEHAEHTGHALKVENAWARATIGNSKNSAAYLKLENEGKKEITIVSAKSDVSARTELHTHINDNGVMKMRRLETGLKVPADGETVLQPGGKHIMLMGLKKPLAQGDHFKIELMTASGKRLDVKVIVQKKAPAGGAHHHSGHKGH